MNPFSAFLQPAPQRPLDMSGAGDIVRTVQEGRQFKQRQLENTQQNDRANSYLKIQQDQQSRKFTEEEQKQQEALLAEYHDAVDKFDPSDPGSQVRIQRATEMMKRFGIDSQQSGHPPANLRAFTGQDLLPSVPKAKPNAEASEKPFQNPIDQAVETEQASREALRAKNEAPLSQEDAEAKLIADAEANPAPERMETPEGTTPEARAYLDKAHPAGPDELPPPTRDMGDVDSPQFRAAAKNEVMDLDEGRPPQQIGQPLETSAQAPQAAAALPPRLPGQFLPTIISKGGKVLESSPGQAGRYSPMVAAVFEPYTRHENPEIAQAGQKAQALAARLASVDGVTPKQAIEIAGKQMQEEIQGIQQLQRTIIGSRAHVVGSGKGGGDYSVGAGGKADAALNDDVDKVRTMWVNSAGYKKMEEQAGQLDDAEGGLMSPDGVAQNNALATLRRIQSGLTLNAQEMADFEGSAGFLERVKKKFERYLGTGQLPEEYKRQVRGTMAHMRQIINQRMERGAQEAYDYWMSTRGRAAKPEIVKEKGAALKSSLRGATPPASPEGEYGGL